MSSSQHHALPCAVPFTRYLKAVAPTLRTTDLSEQSHVSNSLPLSAEIREKMDKVGASLPIIGNRKLMTTQRGNQEQRYYSIAEGTWLISYRPSAAQYISIRGASIQHMWHGFFVPHL